MSKRIILCITLLVTVFLSSTVYGIVLLQNENSTLNIGVVSNKKVIEDIEVDLIINESHEEDFIVNKSGLSRDVAKYIIKRCEDKGLNYFVVLAIMKVESNFNTKIVGGKGERGLGQLMENTAKPVAKNMGLVYKPEYLFDPKYNINLFTSQLGYLNQLFDNDIHKVLTAYNRGEFGLKKYMASRSDIRNPAMSSYSTKVLKYAKEFSQEFENTN